MRGTQTSPWRPIVGYFGVGLLSVSATRALLAWSPTQSGMFDRPTPGPIGGLLLEALLAVLGIALAVRFLSFRPAVSMLALAVALGTASMTLVLSLSPDGHSAIRQWTHRLHQRLYWRGLKGEALVVYPHAAKPNGQQVELLNNPIARNPTYAELMAFLREDRTDQIIYERNKWVCANYAEQVHNNAERAGLRCAFVVVDFTDEAHACNMFETTDRGRVYIDCTSSLDSPVSSDPGSHDSSVEVQHGAPYVPKLLFPGGIGDSFHPMGTVRGTRVSW